MHAGRRRAAEALARHPLVLAWRLQEVEGGEGGELGEGGEGRLVSEAAQLQGQAGEAAEVAGTRRQHLGPQQAVGVAVRRQGDGAQGWAV